MTDDATAATPPPESAPAKKKALKAQCPQEGGCGRSGIRVTDDGFYFNHDRQGRKHIRDKCPMSGQPVQGELLSGEDVLARHEHQGALDAPCLACSRAATDPLHAPSVALPQAVEAGEEVTDEDAAAILAEERGEPEPPPPIIITGTPQPQPLGDNQQEEANVARLRARQKTLDGADAQPEIRVKRKQSERLLFEALNYCLSVTAEDLGDLQDLGPGSAEARRDLMRRVKPRRDAPHPGADALAKEAPLLLQRAFDEVL